MSNADAAYSHFSNLRAIWGERQNDEGAYRAMRAAYAAWQRAAYAEKQAWDQHERLNRARLA